MSNELIEEVASATLLLNQPAIKTAQLYDDCIKIVYADSSEPIFIYPSDELYDVHRYNFEDLVRQGKQLHARQVAEDEGKVANIKG